MENIDGQKEKKPAGNITMYVIGINLLILILYTIIFRTSGRGEDVLFGMAFIIAFQCIFNLIAGVILISFRKLERYGRACFLSALVVLLIGFSTCFIVSS